MKRYILYIILILGLTLPFSDCDAKVRYKKATKIGMVKDDPAAAEKNYTLLQTAVSQKRNVKLNGTFYVKFPKPIILDHTFHVTGGEMRIVSGNCFDFVDGGGFVATSTIFKREDINEDKVLCGTWETYNAVLADKFHLIKSEYYGKYLFQLMFNDINSDEVKFGINEICVKDSYLYNGGRVLIRNGVIWNACSFTGNIYDSFPITPIYIVYSHSKRRYPNEAGTYQFVENNYSNSSPVTISLNNFIGKIQSYNNYYCSALVQSKVCYFNDNYIRDIVNYADTQTLPYATCYDAYLSCAEVYFKRNIIENVISFSKNGAQKPQCEIGKSKVDLLAMDGSKSIRHFEDNTYLLDGNKFLELGAERNSLYACIFSNSDPIYSYKWNRNKVIFKNADLYSRSSSSSYVNFEMNNNLFDVYTIKNLGLCYINTKFDFNEIHINNNDFNLKNPTPFYLFHQLKSRDGIASDVGEISITNNTFKGAPPKIVFSLADTVIIKNNISDIISANSNYFVTDENTKDTYLQAKMMHADLPYFTSGSKGSSVVNISTISTGKFKYYSQNLSCTRSLEGNILLQNDKQISLNILYERDGVDQVFETELIYQSENLSCISLGKERTIKHNTFVTIYDKDGILLKILFNPILNIITYVLTSSEVSQNDEGTMICLEINLT